MPRNFFGGLDRRGDKPGARKPSLWQRLFGGKGGKAKKASGPDPGRGAASMGHKGIAAGSLKEGEQDLTAGNVAQWQTISGDVVEAFVYDQHLLQVHSTWIRSALYRHDTQQLELEFLDGAVFRYDDVSPAEALEWAKATSKGGVTHDIILGRGTSRGSRLKKATRIR